MSPTNLAWLLAETRSLLLNVDLYTFICDLPCILHLHNHHHHDDINEGNDSHTTADAKTAYNTSQVNGIP